MERKIKLTIKNIMEGSQKFEVDLPSSASVADLKMAIFLRTQISSSDQALIYRKNQLTPDESLLQSFGITNNSIITLNAVVTTGRRNTNSPSDHILEVIAHLLSRDKKSKLSIVDSKSSKRKNRKKQKQADELQPTSMDSDLSEKRNSRHESIDTISSSKNCTDDSSKASLISSNDISNISDNGSSIRTSDDLSTDMSVVSMDISEVKDSSSDSLKLKCKCQLKKCGKRLSLTEQTMTCRCEKSFCLKHRGPESHLCPIDYKQLEREKLRKDNPKVDSRTCNKNLNW
ncbi:unnamed protein product [Auanema sp. JU1783]|nr:unnamed protein product [Auanema sp. JU1783]